MIPTIPSILSIPTIPNHVLRQDIKRELRESWESWEFGESGNRAFQTYEIHGLPIWVDVNRDPRVTLNTGISVSQTHPDRLRKVLGFGPCLLDVYLLWLPGFWFGRWFRGWFCGLFWVYKGLGSFIRC